MDLDIRFNQGIGPLLFGMTRTEVRRLIGGRVKEFRKTPSAKTLTDAFEGDGIYVYYSSDDRCEAVELASPADPTLNGKPLIGVPFRDARRTVEVVDSRCEIDDTGLLSLVLGIGLYVPGMDEREDSVVESVIVFREGYYN